MSEKGKKKTTKIASNGDFDQNNSKMPSMKTASDVISRLLWDDSMDQNKFSVGYLDRFDGIIEKPFTSLDWRDPSIVDNHTLALPKHRIQYFKYLSRKVWDKRNRTDIVFGSTGYPLNIHDFMAKVDNDLLNFREEEDIDVDYSSAKNNSNLDCSEEITNEDDIDITGRPNFFIAARIENENTVSKLKEVTDYIKSKDELLGECCISSAMFHMTFSILKLDSPADICDAIAAMQAVSLQKLPLVNLNLEGLDNFHHRVLYSRVEENENLLNLRNALINELVSRNVTITDRFSFVPHVTVAKLSRPVTRLRHSKYIDQYLYLKFEDDEFGSEKVSNLYLCEMGAARREDGFYRCAHEISLNS
ncbi:leukocyte receptor cluster member 9 [Trichonephila inaurata madagascariensis]|uniref:Leukocyte receptor cluster member 9 n=1 Tax=Trichonephila inaurata madagascariensis TaxID=2747483 RepID=A0A8X6WM21_9ARAC|nr:leukocyte receptor cluster member 9 [Trichonephila inaurata madagascariensis]